jgi:HAE1 family hydrophobic/amphiphilic exporter-1
VRQKEEHLKMAQNRAAAGVATELDVLRSNVDLENQRTQLLRYRGRAEITRSRLNAVMVRPIDTPIEPTDSLDYVPLDVPVDEAVRIAWENRPEARAVALSEQIYDSFIGIAQAEHQPSLDFAANWGYSVRQFDNFGQRDFQAWNLGINLKIPIFDGFRTAGKVVQARAERAKVTQDRVALENEIRLEAKGAWDRLSVAKGIYEAAELNVQQAQKALDMTQANYNYGAATLLDVLDAQAALTLAESTRAEALFEHANARARMRYVMAREVLDPQPAFPAIAKTGDQ